MYALGNLDCLSLPLLGVVGPRMMSSYAQEVTYLLLDSASRYRLATVSGLAKGVDQLVHQRCVELNIPTIAVL
jgi:DNA processing protein